MLRRGTLVARLLNRGLNQSSPIVPANALRARDGSYILDRNESYIVTRV